MHIRYVSETDFDALCDAREQLYADADGTYDAVAFERACELASAEAQGTAQVAGYRLPDVVDPDSVSDLVRLLALSSLLSMAYARKQQDVPEATTERLATMIERARRGEMQLPGYERNTLQGIGGVGTIEAVGFWSGLKRSY